jgi:hypothetical protein
LCQKSGIRWLKEGERNTKFFHTTTIARRTHNKILKISDRDGIERESHKEIENTLVNHFQGIAQEPNLDKIESIQRIKTKSIQRITQHIPRLVTEEQNININKPIKKEEINKVV